MIHKPVMVEEIVSIFSEIPEGVIVDATLGPGGHTKALMKSLGEGFRFVGIDRDGETLETTEREFSGHLTIRKMNFAELPSFLRDERIFPVTGALFDLGLSSAQLDDSSRGFSFQADSRLDMRFDRGEGRPLADILAEMSETETVRILKEYGQEKQAKAIARAIRRERPATTESLAHIVRKIAGPGRFTKSAARVFQAFRIFINDEIESLKEALSGIIPMLESGGRIAVLSYHSLEDGLVKRIFSLNAGKCQCGPGEAECVCGRRNLLSVITKKPLRPSDREIKDNPRARSARLRYAQKI